MHQDVKGGGIQAKYHEHICSRSGLELSQIHRCYAIVVARSYHEVPMRELVSVRNKICLPGTNRHCSFDSSASLWPHSIYFDLHS